MKHIKTVLNLLGGIIIFGTAGAFDCSRIDLKAAFFQVLFGLSLMLLSCLIKRFSSRRAQFTRKEPQYV